jgi:putative ABC transport system substrate-binding protein
VTAFARALRSLGLVEGKNIRIEYRFGPGDPTLFKTYAAELIVLSADAILASGIPVIAAMQQQTLTIPTVFVYTPDPVGLGFVQSLARPDGNITGFSSYDAPLMGKWLQLLKEIAPNVTRVAVLFNSDTVLASLSREIDAAARSLGMTVALRLVDDDAGIEEITATLAREPGGGLMILPPILTSHIAMS